MEQKLIEIIKQNEKSRMTFYSISKEKHKYDPIEGLIKAIDKDYVFFIEDGVKTYINLKNIDYFTID